MGNTHYNKYGSDNEVNEENRHWRDAHRKPLHFIATMDDQEAQKQLKNRYTCRLTHKETPARPGLWNRSKIERFDCFLKNQKDLDWLCGEDGVSERVKDPNRLGPVSYDSSTISRDSQISCHNAACQGVSIGYGTYGYGYKVLESGRDECDAFLSTGWMNKCIDQPTGQTNGTICKQIGEWEATDEGFIDKGYTVRDFEDADNNMKRKDDEPIQKICKYTPRGKTSVLVRNKDDLKKILAMVQENGNLEEEAKFDAFNAPIAEYCLASEYKDDSQCTKSGDSGCPPILSDDPEVSQMCNLWFKSVLKASKAHSNSHAIETAMNAYCDKPKHKESRTCACLNALKPPSNGGNASSSLVYEMMQTNPVSLIDSKDARCWVGECERAILGDQMRAYITPVQQNKKCEKPDCVNLQWVTDNENIDINNMSQIINCSKSVNQDNPGQGKPHQIYLGLSKNKNAPLIMFLIIVFVIIIVVIYLIRRQ